jgi:hypothetical protein
MSSKRNATVDPPLDVAIAIGTEDETTWADGGACRLTEAEGDPPLLDEEDARLIGVELGETNRMAEATYSCVMEALIFIDGSVVFSGKYHCFFGTTNIKY